MPRTLQIPTRDGRPVLLRPLVPADEAKLREAIARFSNRSRYLRFFTGLARIPDPVIHRLADADGHAHVAWVAIDKTHPDEPIIGAVHAIRTEADAPSGEFAIGLVDDWHGAGLARLLIALLVADAKAEGVKEMTADVLWENRKGKALMKSLGAASAGSDGTVVRYRFEPVRTLAHLRETLSGPAAEAVFRAIDSGEAAPVAA